LLSLGDASTHTTHIYAEQHASTEKTYAEETEESEAELSTRVNLRQKAAVLETELRKKRVEKKVEAEACQLFSMAAKEAKEGNAADISTALNAETTIAKSTISITEHLGTIPIATSAIVAQWAEIEAQATQLTTIHEEAEFTFEEAMYVEDTRPDAAMQTLTASMKSLSEKDAAVEATFAMPSAKQFAEAGFVQASKARSTLTAKGLLNNEVRSELSMQSLSSSTGTCTTLSKAAACNVELSARPCTEIRANLPVTIDHLHGLENEEIAAVSIPNASHSQTIQKTTKASSTTAAILSHREVKTEEGLACTSMSNYEASTTKTAIVAADKNSRKLVRYEEVYAQKPYLINRAPEEMMEIQRLLTSLGEMEFTLEETKETRACLVNPPAECKGEKRLAKHISESAAFVAKRPKASPSYSPVVYSPGAEDTVSSIDVEKAKSQPPGAEKSSNEELSNTSTQSIAAEEYPPNETTTITLHDTASKASTMTTQSYTKTAKCQSAMTEPIESTTDLAVKLLLPEEPRAYALTFALQPTNFSQSLITHTPREESVKMETVNFRSPSSEEYSYTTDVYEREVITANITAEKENEARAEVHPAQDSIQLPDTEALLPLITEFQTMLACVMNSKGETISSRSVFTATNAESNTCTVIDDPQAIKVHPKMDALKEATQELYVELGRATNLDCIKAVWPSKYEEQISADKIKWTEATCQHQSNLEKKEAIGTIEAVRTVDNKEQITSYVAGHKIERGFCDENVEFSEAIGTIEALLASKSHEKLSADIAEWSEDFCSSNIKLETNEAVCTTETVVASVCSKQLSSTVLEYKEDTCSCSENLKPSEARALSNATLPPRTAEKLVATINECTLEDCEHASNLKSSEVKLTAEATEASKLQERTSANISQWKAETCNYVGDIETTRPIFATEAIRQIEFHVKHSATISEPKDDTCSRNDALDFNESTGTAELTLPEQLPVGVTMWSEATCRCVESFKFDEDAGAIEVILQAYPLDTLVSPTMKAVGTLTSDQNIRLMKSELAAATSVVAPLNAIADGTFTGREATESITQAQTSMRKGAIDTADAAYLISNPFNERASYTGQSSNEVSVQMNTKMAIQAQESESVVGIRPEGCFEDAAAKICQHTDDFSAAEQHLTAFSVTNSLVGCAESTAMALSTLQSQFYHHSSTRLQLRFASTEDLSDIPELEECETAEDYSEATLPMSPLQAQAELTTLPAHEETGQEVEFVFNPTTGFNFQASPTTATAAEKKIGTRLRERQHATFAPLEIEEILKCHNLRSPKERSSEVLGVKLEGRNEEHTSFSTTSLEANVINATADENQLADGRVTHLRYARVLGEGLQSPRRAKKAVTCAELENSERKNEEVDTSKPESSKSSSQLDVKFPGKSRDTKVQGSSTDAIFTKLEEDYSIEVLLGIPLSESAMLHACAVREISLHPPDSFCSQSSDIEEIRARREGLKAVRTSISKGNRLPDTSD